MDSEPHLIKQQSSKLDPPFPDDEINKPSSDNEDPYSFSSTSTSLIGLAIVFVMLGIPFLTIINERLEKEKSILPTSIDKYGSESPAPITISWISKSSC